MSTDLHASSLNQQSEVEMIERVGRALWGIADLKNTTYLEMGRIIVSALAPDLTAARANGIEECARWHDERKAWHDRFSRHTESAILHEQSATAIRALIATPQPAAIQQAPDRLRLDYINSLPQPFLIRLYGDKTAQWPMESIDVQTGLLRFDVCGKLQVGHIGDVAEFIDADGVSHAPDTFYSDYEPTPQPDPRDAEVARLQEALERSRAAMVQARGALLLDAMVDAEGKRFGTTEVALEDLDRALATGPGGGEAG